MDDPLIHGFPKEIADVIIKKYGYFDCLSFVIDINTMEAQINDMFIFVEDDIASPFIYEREIDMYLRGGMSMDLIFVEPCLHVNEAMKFGRWKVAQDMYSYVIHRGWNVVRAKEENKLNLLNGRVRLWAFRVDERIGIAMANFPLRGICDEVNPGPRKQESSHAEAPKQSQENVNVHTELEKQKSTDVEASNPGSEEKVNVHAEQTQQEKSEVEAQKPVSQENVDVHAEPGKQERANIEDQPRKQENINVHPEPGQQEISNIEAPKPGSQEKFENVVNIHAEPGKQDGTNVEAPKPGGQQNFVNFHAEPGNRAAGNVDVHARQEKQESTDVEASEIKNQENAENLHAESGQKEVTDEGPERGKKEDQENEGSIQE